MPAWVRQFQARPAPGQPSFRWAFLDLRRLSFIEVPINTPQRFLQQLEDIGQTGPSPNTAARAQGPTLLTQSFTGTQNFAGGFFQRFCCAPVAEAPALTSRGLSFDARDKL